MVAVLRPFFGIVFDVFPNLAVVMFISDDMFVVGSLPELHAAKPLLGARERQYNTTILGGIAGQTNPFFHKKSRRPRKSSNIFAIALNK